MHDTLDYFAHDPVYRALPPPRADVLARLRVQRELRPPALARRGRARQGLAARARCPATAGRSSRTCARSTRTCGRTPARSCCSWAARSRRSEEWNHDALARLAPARARRSTQGVQALVRDLNRVYRDRARAVGGRLRARGLPLARGERRAAQRARVRAALGATASGRSSASATSRRCRATSYRVGMPRPGRWRRGAEHRLGATTAARTSATSAASRPRASVARPAVLGRARRCRRSASSGSSRVAAGSQIGAGRSEAPRHTRSFHRGWSSVTAGRYGCRQRHVRRFGRMPWCASSAASSASSGATTSLVRCGRCSPCSSAAPSPCPALWTYIGIWALERLDASSTAIGITFTCGALAATATGYLGGHLSDYLGRKPLILIGFGLESVFVLAYPAAGGRELLGLALVVVASALGSLAQARRPGARGRSRSARRSTRQAYASVRVASNLGVVIGPPIGGTAPARRGLEPALPRRRRDGRPRLPRSASAGCRSAASSRRRARRSAARSP